jgi:hypothetical protein
MVQKDKLLKALQDRLHETNSDEVKILLNELIYKIADGQFNIEVW